MDVQSQINALQQENDQLRAELSAKSDFLSMVVHQLRTPLSAIKWLFAMIGGGDFGNLDEKQTGMIKRGSDSVERVIHLLAEVAQANHLAEWKLSMHIAPMDITPCIENVLEEFSASAQAKNIRLAFHKKNVIPHVMGDHERIRIVIENLMENAIKYNRPGGSVTISAEPFRDTLVISLRDTGIGIPLDEQSKLFNKFYRAQNARHTPGTGIGLYVGKQIIDANHGTLWFESTPDNGTTFFFSLPLAK